MYILCLDDFMSYFKFSFELRFHLYFNGASSVVIAIHSIMCLFNLWAGSLFQRGIQRNISGNSSQPSLIVRQAAARAGPHWTRKTLWHEITGGGLDGTTGQPLTGPAETAGYANSGQGQKNCERGIKVELCMYRVVCWHPTSEVASHC